MKYNYALHYLAAFCSVLVVTGVLVWMGAFEKQPSQITALASAEVPETSSPEPAQSANSTNETNFTMEHGVPKPIRQPNS